MESKHANFLYGFGLGAVAGLWLGNRWGLLLAAGALAYAHKLNQLIDVEARPELIDQLPDAPTLPSLPSFPFNSVEAKFR